MQKFLFLQSLLAYFYDEQFLLNTLFTQNSIYQLLHSQICVFRNQQQ